MQFQSVSAVLEGPKKESTASKAEGKPEGKESPKRQALVEGAQNLLKHIPGESSGFYLAAVNALENPGKGTLGAIFAMALIVLIIVRWAAGASRGIMISTLLAFLLWMFVLDMGFFNVVFPDFISGPFGLILVLFYSTVVTVLASAGKIR